MGIKIRYKNGNLTTKGLQLGYIQVSPYYPTTHLFLELSYDKFLVKGITESGKKFLKSFDKLKDAQSCLLKTK